MSGVRFFHAMACNNAWSNYRLLRAVKELSQREFEAPRAGFFPSLKATLSHNHTIDSYYIDALEKGPAGLSLFENPTHFSSASSLLDAQAKLDQKLISLIKSLKGGSLKSLIQLERKDGRQSESIERVLLHLFQHQIHHRGQAHAMLSSTEIAPPQLDEFFLADEAPLRKEDFLELGFSENSIWAQ